MGVIPMVWSILENSFMAVSLFKISAAVFPSSRWYPAGPIGQPDIAADNRTRPDHGIASQNGCPE